MNLNLSEEEAAVGELFGRLLERECPTSLVRQAEPVGFDQGIWDQLVAAGALDLAVDGVPLGAIGRLAEQCGRFLAPAPVIETVVARRVLAAGEPTKIDDGAVVCVSFNSVGETPVYLPAGAVARYIVARTQSGLWCWDIGSERLAHLENLGSMPLAKLSEEDLVGKPRQLVAEGTKVTTLLSIARSEWQLLLAHALVGAGLAALAIGVEYTKERVQFERQIASFQAVQHRLADSATELRGAQLLCYKAAWAADHYGPGPEASRMAALAFLNACREGFRACSEALHFHGGYGFTLEYDIQLFFRRTKAWPLAVEAVSRTVADAADLVTAHARGRSASIDLARS